LLSSSYNVDYDGADNQLWPSELAPISPAVVLATYDSEATVSAAGSAVVLDASGGPDHQPSRARRGRRPSPRA
jgi:hypothetical protein